MKKTIVKILCAALAVCMLLSGTVSVFASDATYTAQYGDKNSKEVYAQIIDDLDTLLAGAAFNGGTVQEMWKLMPQVNDLLSILGLDLGTGKAEYYVQADESIFARLPEYTQENSIETVDSDVLVAYFAEYPAQIESTDEFKTAVKKFVNKLSSNELYTILFLVLAFGTDIGYSEEETFAYYKSLFGSIDEICALLGVSQEMSLYDAFDLEGMVYGEEDLQTAENMAEYINNIIDDLIPDTVDKAVAIIQSLMLPGNSAKLYGAISNIVTKLSEIVGNLETNLSSLGAELDLTEIKNTVFEIKGYVDGVPLNDDGSVEWNGALGYIVNGVVIPMLAPGMSLQVISFGEDENYPNAILKFSAMNPANLSEADDTADALNVAMHYLYENINANKAKIDFLVNDVLPGLVSLPQEVTDIVNMITSNTESDAVWNIYSLLHVAAGYDEPVYDEEPVTDPETPPSEDKPNTDKPNTDAPGGDKPAGTMPEQNSNGGENKPVLNSSNPNLPNTGAEEMTAAFIVIPLAAAGAFMLAVVLRKRALDK